jgi:hypothetical protein
MRPEDRALHASVNASDKSNAVTVLELRHAHALDRPRASTGECPLTASDFGGADDRSWPRLCKNKIAHALNQF